MATKNVVQGILDRFGQMWPNRDTDSLFDTYYESLKSYNDKILKKGVLECLKDPDRKWMPIPGEIVKMINIDRKDLKHSKELRERYTCAGCHEQVSAISEKKCLDCNGIPPVDRDSLSFNEVDVVDYLMEGRRRCQIPGCSIVGVCIKDPKDTGIWKCKDHYTGLTVKERDQRWKDIYHLMDDKDFKPDWYKGVPF